MSKRSEFLLLKWLQIPNPQPPSFYKDDILPFYCVLYFCLDSENKMMITSLYSCTIFTFSNAGFPPQGCERVQRVVGVLYSPQFSGRALSPAAASSGSMTWGRCSRWGRRDFWPWGPRCGWHLRAHTNATSVMCSMLWSWLVHTRTHTVDISAGGWVRTVQQQLSKHQFASLPS